MLISESGTFKIQVHNFIVNTTATILNLLAGMSLFTADVDQIHCSVRHSSVIRAVLQSNWNRIHSSVSGDLQVSVATNLLLCTERKQCDQSFNPFQHPPYTPLQPPALYSFTCIVAPLSTQTLCRSLRLCALYRHNACQFLINRIGESSKVKKYWHESNFKIKHWNRMILWHIDPLSSNSCVNRWHYKSRY
jgi:hypothetical protein